MYTISASKARQTLPEQLDRVEAGEQVTITRHGRPVAVLVRPEVVRPARTAEAWAGADAIGESLENARRNRDARWKALESSPITLERAEELIAWIREGRDAR